MAEKQFHQLDNEVAHFPALGFTAISSVASNTEKVKAQQTSWTPGIVVDGTEPSGIAYGANNWGRYMVFGPLVVATFRLAVGTKGSGTGVVAFTGLPFNALNQNAGFDTFGGMMVNTNGISGLNTPILSISYNNNQITPWNLNTGTRSRWVYTNFGAAYDFDATVIYLRKDE